MPPPRVRARPWRRFCGLSIAWSRSLSGNLEDRTYVVYISPLKALGNDFHKNLQDPLAGIQRLTLREGINLPEIRAAVRSGDTPAWERDVFLAHVANYDPADLEALCLSGPVAWGRLRPRNGVEGNGEANSSDSPRRPPAPTRSAPLAFFLRDELPKFLANLPGPLPAVNGLSSAAREVAAFLREHGASFLSDIARGTGHLASKVEEALWELVARGLVTGDGIAGLRAPPTAGDQRKRYRRTSQRLMPMGRWALLHTAYTWKQ